MGTVFIFRGKAAAGKTTLSNLLSEQLSIPVFRKDDIIDAMKCSKNMDKRSLCNEVYYNILYQMLQTNLDLHASFIVDIALGDRKSASVFLDRLNLRDNTVLKFFVNCSDEDEWKRRHSERLKNPLPHQSFQSLSHLLEHYKKADIRPFDDEVVIDTAEPVEECIEKISRLASSAMEAGQANPESGKAAPSKPFY